MGIKEDKTNIDKPKKVHNRKRVNRLKKIIVTTVLSLLCITSVLCVLGLIKVRQLEKQLYGYTAKEVSSETVLDDNKLKVSTGNYPGNQDVQTLVNPSVNTIYDYEYSDFNELPVVKSDEYNGLKKVYLTFDDGPSSNTDHILDVLNEYGVKATFFVNGHEGYDAQYLRIVNDGHSIGMHSFSHVYKDVYADLDSFADDLYRIHSYISDLTGVDCKLYRFPGGSSNRICKMSMQECIDYLDAKGIAYFDWNVSCEDAVAGGASVNTIVNNVINQVTYCDSDTIVVLMHDTGDKRTTVEALPIIIEKLANMENVVLLPITDSTPYVHHPVSH